MAPPTKKKKKREQLRKALRWFEHFTDKVIPILLVALGIVLILENPLWTLVHLEEYEPWITIFDYTIVTFFVADLIFKWFKVKKLSTFLKLYWIEILAVFPFYFIFRLYTRLGTLLRISSEIREAQTAAHEALLIREASLIREAELAKEVRLLRETRPLVRALRLGQRLLRLLKGRVLLGKTLAKRKH